MSNNNDKHIIHNLSQSIASMAIELATARAQRDEYQAIGRQLLDENKELERKLGELNEPTTDAAKPETAS